MCSCFCFSRLCVSEAALLPPSSLPCARDQLEISCACISCGADCLAGMCEREREVRRQKQVPDPATGSRFPAALAVADDLPDRISGTRAAADCWTSDPFPPFIAVFFQSRSFAFSCITALMLAMIPTVIHRSTRDCWLARGERKHALIVCQAVVCLHCLEGK